MTNSLNENLVADLDRFYSLIALLKNRLGGFRYLSDCDGRMNWPKRGVYFFFEQGEFRKDRHTHRVVRVGTHAVSTGSKTTLWNRLISHRGHIAGNGNHRGSVFRLLVGSALINRREYTKSSVTSWGIGNSAHREIREHEQAIERDVTEYIGKMPFLWIAIDDEPGPGSRRKYIERNSIGLLSRVNGNQDLPSENWLGYSCKKINVGESGLWNSDHVREHYGPVFLDELEYYINYQSGSHWMNENSEIEKISQIRKDVECKPISNWIATVILKSDLEISHEKNQSNNPVRISEMECILRIAIQQTLGDGVILFPGGWVHTQYERADKIYPEIEQRVKDILVQTNRNIIVCIGIDGFFNRPIAEDPFDQDQMAIAIDRTGIIAIGRKFHATDNSERENIILAKNYQDGELGKPRIFVLNGVKYFPFVCYDVYGPYKEPKKYLNPDVQVGLNLIHRFRPSGEFLSQENYFPLNGWSEASYQWQIPVFGTAIFFRRSIPFDWPTGIFWKLGDTWRKPKYREISLPHDLPIISIPLIEGYAEVRIFTDISEKIESMNGPKITDYKTKPIPQIKNNNLHTTRKREVFNKVIEVFQAHPDIAIGLKRYILRKNQCRFSFPQWPRVDNKSNKSIFYEFNDWIFKNKSEISVEIEFWSESFEDIGEIIQHQKDTFAMKMPGNPTVVWDTAWSPGWGRLKYIFPDNQDPKIIAQSMIILINETKEIVNSWLLSKNMEHY